jgi:hypothetical protein
VKYMLLLNRTTDTLPEPGTAEFDQMIQAYGAALEALAQAPAENQWGAGSVVS